MAKELCSWRREGIRQASCVGRAGCGSRPGSRGTSPKNERASIRGEQPVAFEELLHPFLRLARETLRKESGAAYSLLTEVARRQWVARCSASRMARLTTISQS